MKKILGIFSTSAYNRQLFFLFLLEHIYVYICNTKSKLQNITAGKSLKSKSPICCPHCAGEKKEEATESRNLNDFRTARLRWSFYRYQRRFFVFIFFFFSVTPLHDNAISCTSRRTNKRSPRARKIILSASPSRIFVFAFLLNC